MPRTVHVALLALAAACAAGCGSSEDGAPDAGGPCETVDLAVDGSVLSLCVQQGWVRLSRADGTLLLEHGVAVATLDATDRTGRVFRTDDPGTRMLDLREEADALGTAERLVLTTRPDGDAPTLIWTVTGYPEEGFFTFQLAVRSTTDEEILLAKAAALHAEGPDGGLFLGAHPRTHRILENGSYTLLDFLSEIRPGDTHGNPLFSSVAPGNYEGYSVANWNHAVVDVEGDSVWIAGALTVERTIPTLDLSYQPSSARTLDDGRTGFSYFSAEAAFLPEGKPVPPGEAAASEVYYVHPDEEDPLGGLERYADRLAAYNDIVPWTRRDGGQRVPNGWNSWTGSGSTGGYGTDIDEEIILANLDVMANELRDWGMDWFQVDDGYEPRYGDWLEWRADRFPHGPRWLADQIRARGLRPGLWMAPFTPSPDSQVAREHPEWLAEKIPLGTVVGGGDNEALDLTHPGARGWLRELFRTFHEDWGFEWFKMDFAYGALFGTDFHDPTLTREEAWRSALGLIREEIGPETFFLVVGTIGMNYGLADSARTTLDSQPVWDWQPGLPFDDHLEQQGLKPTVRTAGRRWYMQDRIWVNHPDLIFFRSNTRDDTWPRLRFEEARAFATFVGLSGGIVKLGDRLVDLQPKHIDVIRRLLPIYPGSARPLDVFEREYPEVWHTTVEPIDGYSESYELIGLFDWGLEVDLTVNPYREIPDDDGPTTHRIDLDAMGLDGEWLAYEFWTQSFLGRVEGELVHEVPSHDGHVIALRRPTGAPQLLGFNRQITMGGVLVESSAWDPDAVELRFEMHVAAPTATVPFVYEVAFYVPDGFALSDLATSGVPTTAVETTDEGEVLRVRFVPEETGDLTLVLAF